MSNKVEEITKFAKRVLLSISCVECYEHEHSHNRFNYESHTTGAFLLKLLLEQNNYSIDDIIDKKTQTFFERWNVEAGQPVKGESDEDDIDELFDIFVDSYGFRDIARIHRRGGVRFVDEFVQIMEL